MHIEHVEAFVSEYQKRDDVLNFWLRHLPYMQARKMSNIARLCYMADGSVGMHLEALTQHLTKNVGCWISGCLPIKIIGISDYVELRKLDDWIDFADYVRDLLSVLDHPEVTPIDFWEPARPLTSGQMEARSVHELQSKPRQVARLLIDPTAELIESVAPMSPCQFIELRELVFRTLEVLLRYAFSSLKDEKSDRVDEIEHLITLIVDHGNIPIGFRRNETGMTLNVLARPRSVRTSSLLPFDD
jgi:hypothetical protein